MILAGLNDMQASVLICTQAGPPGHHAELTEELNGLTGMPWSAGVQSIKPLIDRLDKADIQYTMSKSGRPAVFFRDPDANVLELAEMGVWRE